MIELRHDRLLFTFPDVHPEARLSIDFQRTLRIPDDDREYPLPPGLGSFPLRHVDDFAERVPPRWLEHGGVMLPMYQSEAMWLCFHPDYVREHDAAYPFAIKVAAGKIDAVTGKAWATGRSNALQREPQNYLVAPGQPWLDGFCVEKGVIRQFVAMPLGAGYSVEEQLTGAAEHGGLQIAVYPMKREAFERRFPKGRADTVVSMLQEFCLSAPCASASPDMGLAPGGRMRQEIYEDEFDLDDWDLSQGSRCFVHIANSLVWQSITGVQPPHAPPTAKHYTAAGLPWFDFYSDKPTVDGSSILKAVKSVLQMGKEKRDVPLPENESCAPERVVKLRQGLKKGQVREGIF